MVHVPDNIVENDGEIGTMNRKGSMVPLQTSKDTSISCKNCDKIYIGETDR